MFRPIVPADTPILIELTAGTHFFKPIELVALREVLDDYHDENIRLGHRGFAFEEDGRITGYVYHAPVSMTEATWYLYWIAVDADQQRRGLGAQFLQFVEDDVRGHGGRLLLIETSSMDRYQPTRRFYEKHGYAPVAHIPDFYADNDGLTVYWKRLDRA